MISIRIRGSLEIKLIVKYPFSSVNYRIGRLEICNYFTLNIVTNYCHIGRLEMIELLMV